MNFKRIVVATDFSKIAERAARQAFALAEVHHAQVYLVHAIDLGGLVTVGPGGIEPYVDLVSITRSIRREAEQNLEAFVKKLACPVTIRPEVHAGAPAEVILQVADDRNADLIVCGTHGRSGLKRMLFGSVAEKVIRSTHRPVLLVPPLREAAADTPEIQAIEGVVDDVIPDVADDASHAAPEDAEAVTPSS